jgi:hypothetical protein
MSKYKVLVLQENYEYYECDEQGQPTGDMVDHNYDIPYSYVVYDTDNDIYLDVYDTYEGAKDSVDRYAQDGEFDLDYADDVKMWELVKFNAMADEWQPQGVYFEDETKGEEFVKSLNEKRGE